MAPALSHDHIAAYCNPKATQPNDRRSCTASKTQLPAHAHEHSNSAAEERAILCKNSSSRCMKFFSTSGCPYGEQCHFQHFNVSQGIGQLACTINMANLPTLQGAKKSALLLTLLDPSLHVKGYKTKLCHNHNSSTTARGGCKYGEHCHFAHSEAELRSRIAILSNAHCDEQILEQLPSCLSPCSPSNKGHQLVACLHATPMPSPNYTNVFFNYCKPMKESTPMNNLSSSLYYGEPSPPGVPLPCDASTVEDNYNKKVATSISIDAGMAGFIIGRAGGNVRQISKLTGSRLSIREHSTKVRIVHIEGLPHQVDGAQEILKLLLEAREGSKKSGL